MTSNLHQNRDDIYNREEQIHDDSEFSINREKQVDMFYSSGSFNKAYKDAFESMGDLRDKKVLEIGCGDGRNILKFNKSGAIYAGIDISGMRIAKARKVIIDNNLEGRANAFKMNAEKIDFLNGSFDVIYGEAIIHHLDINTSMIEIKRLLKENGIAIFLEPRGDNPIINRFRKKTPSIRTIDEHPLVLDDYKLMKRYFNLEEKNYFLFSLISLVFKKYIKSEFMYKLCRIVFDPIDSLILTWVPFTRKYAWYTLIKLSKN